MGVTSKASFSEISKSHYLFSTFNYFRLRKLIDEKPYFLKVRLGDFFEVISGFAFSSKDYTDEGVLVCRIGDISKTNELLVGEMLRLPEEYFEQYEKYRVQKDDILIGLTGDGKYFKTCLVELDEPEILLNQRVGILRLKKGVSDIAIKFIAHLFNIDEVQNQIRIVAMGKTQKNVSPFDILNVKIPNVDYSKQNELLEKIKPLELEISNLKNSKLQPVNIINQVFGEAFGFSGDFYKEFGKGMTAGTQQSNPKEKSIYKVPFSHIAKSNIVRVSSRFHNPKMQFLNERLHSKSTLRIKNILTEKAHRGASPQYDTDGEIPVIKTAHLKNGYVEVSEDEFVNEAFYKKSIRSQVFENDVLIASTGKVSLGKVDIVLSDQNFVVDGHITILRINQDLYNPLFLTYFLRSILGTYQIERDFTGATNQIELYTSEIENFDIPNFTLEQQAEIVEKIKSQLDEQTIIDRLIEEKQQSINKIIEDAIKLEQN